MTEETSGQKNDSVESPVPVFETEIAKLVNGGAGLGHIDKKAVFIPGTAPGEVVRARVVKQHKGYTEGELVEILTPSADRIEPPMGDQGSASGCDLQHLNISAQRAIKQEIVRDCLQRQGRMDLGDQLSGPEAIGPELGYRNKIRLTRSDLGLYGMIRKATHEVIPVESVPLMPAAFDRDILPYLVTLPPVDQIVARMDTDGGSLLSLFGQPPRLKMLKQIIAALPPGDAPYPGCTGILFNNRPAWGRDHLLVKLLDRTWRVHANSFFQVNYEVTAAALQTLRDWLSDEKINADTPAPLLADLYCGVGLFSLAVSDRFTRIVGVENDAGAVRDYRNNVMRDTHAKDKAMVLEGVVDKVTKGWKYGEKLDGQVVDWKTATMIVDPPRAGLGKHVTNDLIELAPARIYYMSCDPATLARDLRALTLGGYTVRRARVFDMFPQTSHIETLVELVRNEGSEEE